MLHNIGRCLMVTAPEPKLDYDTGGYAKIGFVLSALTMFQYLGLHIRGLNLPSNGGCAVPPYGGKKRGRKKSSSRPPDVVCYSALLQSGLSDMQLQMRSRPSKPLVRNTVPDAGDEFVSGADR